MSTCESFDKPRSNYENHGILTSSVKNRSSHYGSSCSRSKNDNSCEKSPDSWNELRNNDGT